MQFFGDVFEEENNIDLNVFDDVLQNAKHHEMMHLIKLFAHP